MLETVAADDRRKVLQDCVRLWKLPAFQSAVPFAPKQEANAFKRAGEALGLCCIAACFRLTYHRASRRMCFGARGVCAPCRFARLCAGSAPWMQYSRIVEALRSHFLGSRPGLQIGCLHAHKAPLVITFPQASANI